jgi:major membrane immunogen (membrane-anchored lipoprotein)
MDQRIPFNEGSSDSATLEDGTYKATYSHMDSHGWRAFVELTVDGGEITDATFDYVNPDGQLKTEDEGYAERMGQYSDNGMTPAEASEALEAGLVEQQDPAAVDVVTGATHSSHNFQDLAAAAIENAKAGDTSTAVLPQNGTYTAEGELDDHGWKPVLEVTFEDGDITEVMYDEFDEEENSKRADEDYNARLEEESDVTVEDAFSQLESRLLEEQSVESVDVVSGATSSSNKFIELANDIMEQRIPFNE